MKKFTGLIIAIAMLLSGCSVQSEPDILITSSPTNSIETVHTESTKTPTPVKKPTSTITLIPTDKPIEISSALEEFPLDSLIDMISNPFNPPVDSSDDPHQGVDFSVVDREYKIALKGSPVSSILNGDVVMIINDRFPYGNAVMIETPVNELPQSWQNRLQGLTPLEIWVSSTNLTCPKGWDDSISGKEEISLFVLYAHLDDISEIQVDQTVESGDILGTVGDSGNALAPHLHVEIRYGYSESFSGGMAHYDVTASQPEMSNYCKWRVSGLFRLIDPMILLLTKP